MALHVIDGMEAYNDPTEATRRANVQKRMKFENTFGPEQGTHPLSGIFIYDDLSETRLSYYVDSSTDSTIWTVGFRLFYNDNLLSDAFTLLEFFALSGTEIASVDVGISGQFQVNRSISTVVSSAAILRPRRWYFIEIKMELDNAGSVEIRVDGVSVLSATGVDLLNGTDDQCQVVGIGWSSTNQVGFADLYILDDGGTTFNTFLGDHHIETLRPDGDGNRNNWTQSTGLTNYETVDEANQNDDTDYVSTSTAGDDDLYTFGNLTVDMDTIPVVQVRMNARKEDGGYREIRALCRSSTSEATGDSQSLNVDRYKHVHGFFFQNPNGPAAWTEAAVNAAEFGFELVT